MKTIPLPRTGLTVSQLCLGTNQFGTALDEPRAHEMLDTFRASAAKTGSLPPRAASSTTAPASRHA